MCLKKFKLGAYMQKQLTAILLCIPIFFDPIVNHNALVVKPGKTDDQFSNNGTSVGITIPDQEKEANTADVSTVKKEVDQLPSK